MAAVLEFSSDFAVDEKGTVLSYVDQYLTDDVFAVRPVKVYHKFVGPHTIFHIRCKSQIEANLLPFPDFFAYDHFTPIVNNTNPLFLRQELHQFERNTDERKRSRFLSPILQIHGVDLYRACPKVV